MKTSIINTLAVVGLCTGLIATAHAQEPPAGTATTATADPNSAIVVMPEYTVRPTETFPVNVGPEYAGRHVEMVFRVDENGRAYNIDADTSNMPDRYTNIKTASLVTQLALAIQGWQFEPARDANGNPVDRQVRLPINLG